MSFTPFHLYFPSLYFKIELRAHTHGNAKTKYACSPVQLATQLLKHLVSNVGIRLFSLLLKTIKIELTQKFFKLLILNSISVVYIFLSLLKKVVFIED